MSIFRRILLGLVLIGTLGGLIFGPVPAIGTVAYASEVDEEEEDSVDPDWVGDEEESERRGKANEKGLVETDNERKIYSYVQCPDSHYDDKRWVGDWTDIEAGGQTFWGFGCGICCLTNMVDTLTDHEYTPDEMYYKCKEVTDYYPESGSGALSWEQLRSVSEYFGLTAMVCEKPDYESFQADIAGSETAVVLVCKYDDDKLWVTNGHYVNIWAYDADTDTVFVTDSSSLHNRERVALCDIYYALKTSSDYQYMCVGVYE